jgi:hypothetical protein
MKRLIQLLCILLPAIFFSCTLKIDSERMISSRLANPVTLDGQITSLEEWAETNAYDFLLDTRDVENAAAMTIRLKNDDTWLYMLYKIAWSPSDIDSNDVAGISLFTAPYGPPWAESDRGSVSFGGQTWDSYGWDDTQWYKDIDAGGQNDVEGAASYDGAFYWFEFRKRLNSGDGYDWALQPPQIVPDSYESDLRVALWDYSLAVGYGQNISLQLSE